jgi:RHS repeat-associated protein
MYYDPRGHVIRTVNPDGSEQRVIFGVPTDLTNPDVFTPTPWESYTYDANDNAGRTHPNLAAQYQSHWNTPASIVVDALGRTVTTISRNGPNPTTDWLVTRSTYDIQGNLLTVTDALNRVALRYVYDLAQHPLRTESIDAGLRRIVLDALGNPIEGRDSKGAVILHAYDVLQRPIRIWARDGDGQGLTLRERLVYGDAADSGLTPVQALATNLLGKPYQHYDEAGLVMVESYDFKGNGLEKVQQVISDAAVLQVFNPPPVNWQVQPFRVDWQPPAGSKLPAHAAALLDATVYHTSMAYDGLNRIKVMHYPQDVEGKRRELRPHYNRAGALEQVQLDGVTSVEHIAYSAKGQRLLIAYGNGVMTRYAYDPQTARLQRLRTERYTNPSALTYHPTGAPLQDCAYQYDLVGNITAIQDRTPDSGVLNTRLGKDALNRTFTYDPLYRLLSATGRECDLPPAPPWSDQPRGVDLTRARDYSEQYQYDPAGNLTRIQHQSGSNGCVRELSPASTSNRLVTMTMGQSVFDYTYDVNGNLLQETNARHFEWDHSDRMRVFHTQVGAAEPSVYTHYLYDTGGQRVKKLARKQGGQVEVTVYIDGVFEYQRTVQGSTVREHNTLHVMDNQSRIALVRVGAPFPDDTTPAVQCHLGDRLGSSTLVLDNVATLVNREEYTPYGETSFGSFAKKRYRFTGKERDDESGLYYHGARYYAPWLGRWTAADPVGMVDGLNLYRYARNNPLKFIDPHGTDSKVSPNDPQVRAYEQRLNHVRGNLKPIPGIPGLSRYRVAGAGGGKASPPPSGPTGGLSKMNALDSLTAVAGLTNFATPDRDGVSGGIPGGHGPKEHVSVDGQAAYIALSIFNVVNLIEGIFSAVKAFVTAAFEQISARLAGDRAIKAMAAEIEQTAAKALAPTTQIEQSAAKAAAPAAGKAASAAASSPHRAKRLNATMVHAMRART